MRAGASGKSTSAEGVNMQEAEVEKSTTQMIQIIALCMLTIHAVMRWEGAMYNSQESDVTEL